MKRTILIAALLIGMISCSEDSMDIKEPVTTTFLEKNDGKIFRDGLATYASTTVFDKNNPLPVTRYNFNRDAYRVWCYKEINYKADYTDLEDRLIAEYTMDGINYEVTYKTAYNEHLRVNELTVVLRTNGYLTVELKKQERKSFPTEIDKCN